MVLKGVFLSDKKPLWLALTGIYGIGIPTGKKIVNSLRLHGKKLVDLSNDELAAVNLQLDQYTILGDLTNERKNAVLDLITIKCNRGIRHVKKYPVRGQSTRNNAVTCIRAKKW